MKYVIRNSMLATAVIAATAVSAKDCPVPTVLPTQYSDLRSMVIFDAEKDTYFTDNQWLAVSKGGKTGFISTDGKRMIEPVYEEIIDYWHEGILPVQKEGKWGFIDREGKEVIAPQFAIFWSVQDGMVAVGSDKEKEPNQLIDLRGKTLPLPDNVDSIDNIGEGMVGVKIGDKYGYANTAGELVIEAKYDRISSFYEGFAEVGIDNLSGIIDKTGREIIPLRYYYIMRSQDGYFIPVDHQESTMAVFNRKGEQVLPAEYSMISEYEEESSMEFRLFIKGITIALKNEYWGVIDEQGKEILPFEYERLSLLDNGWLIAAKDGKEGVIDRQGKVIIPFEYESLSYAEGIFMMDKRLPNEQSIKNNATVRYSGILDGQGKELIPPQYENVKPLPGAKNYAVYTKGGYRLFDAAGKAVSDDTWDYIVEGLDGMLKVSKNDRLGYIDEKGEVLIKPQYDYVTSVEPNYILTFRGKRRQLLDKQGCVLIDMAGHWKK